MPKVEILQGTIKRIISQKDDWVCFVINCDLFLEVTVTATIGLTLSKDQEIKVFGKFVEHPKFGQQFKASKIELLSFKTKDAASRFLDFLLPSLSKKTRKKIISKLGSDVFGVLEGDLESVKFLDADQKNYIRSRLVTYQAEKKALSFLFDLDLSPTLCGRAIEIYGSKLIEAVKENPYCLSEIEDFPFQEVDRLAQEFGVEPSDRRRVCAVVSYLLRDIAPLRGHLFLTMSDLFGEINLFNGHFDPIPDEQEGVFRALKGLRSAKKIEVESRHIYAEKWFRYEKKSATRFVKFFGKNKIKTNVGEFIKDYEIKSGVQFSEEQEQAVKAFAGSKVFVITGYPGTGKTFVTKVLVDLFKKENLSFVLLTPTGISAKKLSLITGEEAGTIHRVLGYTGKSKPWKFNSEQKFAVDVAVIDEASMIDQEVFFRLLEALPSSTSLIFIGDTAQLPSVAPGNVLRDIINSESVKVVSLTKIFRQSEGSSIKINAKRIHEGKMVDVKEKSAFYFIQETNHDRILKIIIGLSQKFKKRDIQILSPKKVSLIGTHSLNRALKESLNPPFDEEYDTKKEETTLKKGLAFRVDDKVMVTRNDYDREIFNGDCGRVLKIDNKEKEIHFTVEGCSSVYTYSFSEAQNRLQLAFAITIHKSQGLEYDIVIFPYTLTFHNQLHRNLFYTAVTRAAKRVFIIGDVKALQRAVNTNKIIKRNTFLAERIKVAICEKNSVASP